MSARSRRRHRRTSRSPSYCIGGARGDRCAGGDDPRQLRDQRRRRRAPISQLHAIDQGSNSIVYAADGSRLGYIQSDEARTPVGIEKIPEDLQHATVAIEDERFYEHNGVDLEGITRAAFENLEAGEVKGAARR